MHPLSRFALLFLTFTPAARAQAPATPSPNPTERNVPAEIVPPKPASTPPAGRPSIEATTPAAAVSPGSKQPAKASRAPANEIVDSLTPAELDEVLAFVKERYVAPDTLTETDLKRATVRGLTARLAAGITILPATDAAPPAPSPFRSELLDGRIGYARLGALSAASLAELDAALKSFVEKPAAAVVLDLRATPPGADFELAAEVCRRFCPKGKVLFSLRRPGAKEQIFTSKDDPRFRSLLVVLTDMDTAGSAEIIAATLRTHAGAMLIGQRTKGEAAEFATMPLASGKVLRVAVAEVALPDGTVISMEGVDPDLAVEVPLETTATLLQQQLENGVAPFVFEAERARMNEAALVAGTNPELDALQAAQRHRGERPRPPLRDVALQRAVDLVTTIAIYEQAPRGKK